MERKQRCRDGLDKDEEEDMHMMSMNKRMRKCFWRMMSRSEAKSKYRDIELII